MNKGFLVLESGVAPEVTAEGAQTYQTYEGVWRGGQPRAGEVVFNTSHSGYEEIATDPSYFHQIMVMTAPMQGNYGVERSAWESSHMWIDGFVATEMQRSSRDSSWNDQLAAAGIPVLTDLDTRQIVMRLRSSGTPWGALVPAASAEEARSLARVLIEEKKKHDIDWVYAVTRRDVEVRKGAKQNGPRVAIIDYGVKENTLRELQTGSSEIAVFPSRTPERVIRDWNPSGIMLSNGPGNPADVKEAVENLRSLLGWKPVFGICMGNQILSLALGGKTYKLPFGHRGGNHPVRDHLLNEIYVTSQNHGYCVDAASLPSNARVTHENLNDKTVEGIECASKKCFSVQYHPESHPGPHDARKLFDFFLNGL